MTDEQVLEELRKLDSDERNGKEYFQLTGKELPYYQGIYLRMYPEKTGKEKFCLLESPAAAKEIADIRQHFLNMYELNVVTEESFPEGKNVEVQKLLRYIDIPLHRHDFFEIVTVVDGTVHQKIVDTDYVSTEGDFVIVPPGLPHELHADPNAVCITFKFRSSTFLDVFSHLVDADSPLAVYFSQNLDSPYGQQALMLHCGHDEKARSYLFDMIRQQELGEPYNDLIIESLIQVLLFYVFQKHNDTAELRSGNTTKSKEMLEVLSYIYANYQTITLNEAARHFHVKTAYLSKWIHKETGRTYSELLRSYKLQKAAEFLRTTNWKLDRICGEVGYQDTSQFIRSFKEAYHMTPKQYQIAQRQKS